MSYKLLSLMLILPCNFLNTTPVLRSHTTQHIITRLADLKSLKNRVKAGYVIQTPDNATSFITVHPSHGDIVRKDGYINYVLEKGSITITLIFLKNNRQKMKSINLKVQE